MIIGICPRLCEYKGLLTITVRRSTPNTHIDWNFEHNKQVNADCSAPKKPSIITKAVRLSGNNYEIRNKFNSTLHFAVCDVMYSLSE
jgi:hypothetical protein